MSPKESPKRRGRPKKIITAKNEPTYPINIRSDVDINSENETNLNIKK